MSLRASAVLSIFFLTSCNHVIRDKTTYATELDLWEQGITEGVAAAKPFLQYCTCTEGEFDSDECQTLAENIVVSEALLPLTFERARYLGDLTETAPSEQDPEIPDPGILCPEEDI